MHTSQRQSEQPPPGTAEERALLRRRAARYAARIEAEADHFLEVITFRRGRGRYGVDLRKLREIRPLRSFSPIPGASRAVPGIFLYRGEILSGHDIAAFMSDEPQEGARAPWVLVAEHGEERIGLLADEVFSVESVASQRIHPPPITLGQRSLGLLGVVSDEVLLLDLPGLFANPSFFRAM